jgi:hypothetical protein
MKAQLKPRINLEGRTPLEKVIPLTPPFVVFVDPAGMDKGGESFLNKRLADMVAYAKKAKPIEYIGTTTNGTLLSPDRIGPVSESGIDKINISVDGMNVETDRRFTGFDFDFDTFVENVRWLYANKGNCGDVRQRSMQAIWNSDRMNALRLQHLKGRRRENRRAEPRNSSRRG